MNFKKLVSFGVVTGKGIIFCFFLTDSVHFLNLLVRHAAIYDVCLFICPSVILVDCDHIVQHYLEMGT